MCAALQCVSSLSLPFPLPFSPSLPLTDVLTGHKSYLSMNGMATIIFSRDGVTSVSNDMLVDQCLYCVCMPGEVPVIHVHIIMYSTVMININFVIMVFIVG